MLPLGSSLSHVYRLYTAACCRLLLACRPLSRAADSTQPTLALAGCRHRRVPGRSRTHPPKHPTQASEQAIRACVASRTAAESENGAGPPKPMTSPHFACAYAGALWISCKIAKASSDPPTHEHLHTIHSRFFPSIKNCRKSTRHSTSVEVKS